MQVNQKIENIQLSSESMGVFSVCLHFVLTFISKQMPHLPTGIVEGFDEYRFCITLENNCGNSERGQLRESTTTHSSDYNHSKNNLKNDQKCQYFQILIFSMFVADLFKNNINKLRIFENLNFQILKSNLQVNIAINLIDEKKNLST